MKKVVSLLFLLLLVFFALPALYATVMHLVVPIIICTFFVGLGVYLFQRKRRW